MSIIKRKKKDGSVYYFNTVTKKFAAKPSGKKTAETKSASKGGKSCSILSSLLRTKKSSTAGRKLRCDCRTKRPCKTSSNYM
jgi:hypothetical protein